MNIRLQFFYRYFFSKRSGSIVRSMARISWFATLIGVFSLVLVSSIMNGFNRSIRQKLLAVEPHLVVSGGASDKVQALLARQGLQAVAYVQQDVIIRSLEGHFSGGVVKGTTDQGVRDFLTRLARLRDRKANNTATSDVTLDFKDLGPKEIILGSDLASNLNVFEGDEVMIIPPETLLMPAGVAPKFETMRVRSIINTDIQDLDNQMVLYRLSDTGLRFRSLDQEERGFEVRLANSDTAESAARELRTALTSVGETTAKVMTWGDRNHALFFALKLEKGAMTTFLGLSVLITSFSLITVLVMLLSQKRKEIGLLMALGLSQQKTRSLFLSLGLVLSGVGLFFGLFAGVCVSLFLAAHPLEILPDVYYDSSLPSEVNFVFIGIVGSACLLLAFFSAYWPVRHYLRRSPAENLRPFVIE